jgi:hypothetical protein
MLYLALTFVDESSFSLSLSFLDEFFLSLSLSLFLDEFSISYGLMFLMWDTALIINLTGHPLSFPDSATVCVFIVYVYCCVCLLLCVFIVYVPKENKTKANHHSAPCHYDSLPSIELSHY